MKNNGKELEKWMIKTQSLLINYLAQNENQETPVVKYRPPLELRESMDFSLGKPVVEDAIWGAVETILDKSVRTTHPLFLNQLFGGLHPESISGEWIATILNPTMATFEIAPMMTILEKEVARKLSNMMGLKLGDSVSFDIQGVEIEGVVKNFTEFGLFIGFDSGVDGLVHVSDISEQGLTEEAQKKYKAGDKIKVIVLGSNYEKERISLGIRQIDNPNFQAELDKITENSVVSCLVIAVKKDFLEVELDSGLKAIIKRLDLSNNKQNQKTEKYEVNERIEAKVTMFNKISGKLLLSIKELETDERESHFYSESNSGATIGSIAGDVLESLKDKTS
jgi:predicted RNA-binding protein with RPS1 domain